MAVIFAHFGSYHFAIPWIYSPFFQLGFKLFTAFLLAIICLYLLLSCVNVQLIICVSLTVQHLTLMFSDIPKNMQCYLIPLLSIHPFFLCNDLHPSFC